MDLQFKDLLDAGVHFGHMTSKWHPAMQSYIITEKNGIHIIDLNKTLAALQHVCDELQGVARSGRKILFVATKKQAKDVVATEAQRLKMPFVTERWLGGMLTNFATVRKSLKKMHSLEKLIKDEAQFKTLAKRERLMKIREKAKLERVLGGISDQTRLPAAMFVIDIKREHIAIKEAHKLNIPVYALVDTNSDPNQVDFAVPGNDDAYKSVKLITEAIGKAIEVGMDERKAAKDEAQQQKAEAEKRAVDQGEEVAVPQQATEAAGEEDADA